MARFLPSLLFAVALVRAHGPILLTAVLPGVPVFPAYQRHRDVALCHPLGDTGYKGPARRRVPSGDQTHVSPGPLTRVSGVQSGGRRKRDDGCTEVFAEERAALAKSSWDAHVPVANRSKWGKNISLFQ